MYSHWAWESKSVERNEWIRWCDYIKPNQNRILRTHMHVELCSFHFHIWVGKPIVLPWCMNSPFCQKVKPQRLQRSTRIYFPMTLGRFATLPMMLFSNGLDKWELRAAIGPSRVTRAATANPTNATIAKRPFFTSFTAISGEFMPAGSNGNALMNPTVY